MRNIFFIIVTKKLFLGPDEPRFPVKKDNYLSAKYEKEEKAVKPTA